MKSYSSLSFSRIFTGLVFLYSGFVKAVDPMGSAYKFSDYFDAFHIPFLKPLAIVFSVVLFTMELVVGFNLLVGIRIKLTSWVLLIVMGYFTILTFILALTNPVSDCGCFGDAVILTNWETFWKNIVLLGPTLVIFIERNKHQPYFKPPFEYSLSIVVGILVILFSLKCILTMPWLDFRPYIVGTYIPEKMKIPEGAAQDEYKITYIYEKDGVQKEFEVDNLPWQDTIWKYVDRIDKLVKKGYEPPIHDFTITSLDGFEYTDQILQDTNYSILVVAHTLPYRKYKYFEPVKELAGNCIDSICAMYCMTAATYQEIKLFKNTMEPNFEIYVSDEITLKTIMRTNPGILLLKSGTIIGKWDISALPEYKALITIPPQQLINKQMVVRKMRITIALSMLLVLLVVSIIIAIKKRMPK